MNFKYRAETCVLAGKRLDALNSGSKGEKEMLEAAWLKRACEKVV
jgi:hypothetical protein